MRPPHSRSGTLSEIWSILSEYIWSQAPKIIDCLVEYTYNSSMYLPHEFRCVYYNEQGERIKKIEWLQQQVALKKGLRETSYLSIRRYYEHKSWRGMIDRCNNPQHKNYHRYGGRGIKVCERWLTFKNFLEDMGERPEGMTLDRINNDGDYEPSNCRWATPKEQAQNTSTNVNITINGETHCLTEWSRISGINCKTLRRRLQNGWDHNDLLKPTRYRKK